MSIANHVVAVSFTASLSMEMEMALAVASPPAILLSHLLFDFIHSYKHKNLANIFVVAGVYITTFLIALLIYASRLFTNRQVLAGIPKSYIPIEEEDIGNAVRKLITNGLEKSALVAYQVRPRDLRGEPGWNNPISPIEESRSPTDTTQNRSQRSSAERQDEEAPKVPSWGIISHPGWSSPSSSDIPNLHFEDVIRELPNLIEAKSVSLAPQLPQHHSMEASSSSVRRQSRPLAIPDPEIVEMLRRPPNMGLREYLAYLTSLELINPPTLGEEFLFIYEKARFSTRELDEKQFRTLMGIFAEILRGMKRLPLALGGQEEFSSDEDDTTTISRPNSSTSLDLYNNDEYTRRRPRGKKSTITITRPRRDSSSSSDTASMRTAPLFHQPSNASFFHRPRPPPRHQSSSSLRITTTMSGGRSQPLLHTPSSMLSIGRNQLRDQLRVSSQARPLLGSRTSSVNSLGRVRTGQSSQSGVGSIIRLAESAGPLDLPYTYRIRPERSEPILRSSHEVQR
ncbi:MAG: hypothetical protein M1834_003116 [Cirrosporium novae-zelandiae]|nr:MAG: hypothetical protein M1834_003116 [Cirrosporium novae-zelandiae]